MIDRLIIVGAGGFARELATLLEVNNLAYVHKLRYFVNQEYLGPMVEGIVYRSMYRGSAISEPDLREMDEDHVPDVIFGVGDPNVREKMVNFMKNYLPSKRFVSHYINQHSLGIMLRPVKDSSDAKTQCSPVTLKLGSIAISI